MHDHPCFRCSLRFRCEGDLLRNRDGAPPVICTTYHVHGEDLCPSCQGIVFGDAPFEDDAAEVGA